MFEQITLIYPILTIILFDFEFEIKYEKAIFVSPFTP